MAFSACVCKALCVLGSQRVLASAEAVAEEKVPRLFTQGTVMSLISLWKVETISSYFHEKMFISHS